MFAHARIDDAEDDGISYSLMQDFPPEENNHSLAIPFVTPTQRLNVEFDGVNTVSVSPYAGNVVPTLQEMINAAFASQLRFIIADINQAIEDKSYVKLRQAFGVLKTLINLFVVSGLLIYLAYYLLDTPDELPPIRRRVGDAVTYLQGNCSDTFLMFNGTCQILSNDPPICSLNPLNCPNSNCIAVTNLLNTCDYRSPSLEAGTHDIVPYSTNFYERLRHCNGTVWPDYISTCKDYIHYFSSIPLGLLGGVTIVLLAPIVMMYQCCMGGMNSLEDEYEAKVNERNRILKSKFRELFKYDITKDNLAYERLLQLNDEDKDISVGEVLSNLNRLSDNNDHYTTQRFFRAPSALRIEVVEDELEDEASLLLGRSA